VRPTTRRELIGAAAAGAAFAAVPPAWASRLLSRRAGVGPGRFLDGVASGEPGPTAVTFWSRLNTTRPRSGARLIVAREKNMRKVVATAVVPTGSGINGTLKTRIGGLKPDTEYFYMWESSRYHSEVGRTHTLRPADSAQALKLAFSACQHYSYGYFSAHAHAAREDLDLCVFLGDYIYAEAGPRETSASVPRLDTSRGNDLRSYRDKYRLYRSDPGLRELHRVQPVVHIWDDHEIANNYSDNDPAPSALQRAAGYRAAFEWIPRMVYPSERSRIYKRITLGRVADLFLLDERQYRTGENDDQPRRMLGDAQLRWLTSNLRSSRARWKIIANQVPIAPMDYGNGPRVDSWGGYPEGRERLLGAIDTMGLNDVVFMTGDAHVFMVNLLARDPEVFRADRNHRASAVEYVGGSVTSPGAARDEAAVQADNPWNRQYNGVVHGYAHVAASSRNLAVEYRQSDLSNPSGATTTFERFTQAAGANVPDRLPPPAPPGV
jgi:phosphodiesterase/alkaline phosphatase D-like protein